MSDKRTGLGLRRMAECQQHRDLVLLALVKSPRSGSDLDDTLAVRCGTKDAVRNAREKLKALGLIRGEQQGQQRNFVVWHLTEAGIAEAARLLAERGKARAA